MPTDLEYGIYWMERCKAAEKYIELKFQWEQGKANYNEVTDAYQEWKKLKES